VLTGVLGVLPVATAQPAPVLHYGFGPNDSLRAGGIHDLSGNGHDGTVLNPADVTLGGTDHKGGRNAIHLQHLGLNDSNFGGIFTGAYTGALGISAGPFTACSWVNRDDVTSFDDMVFGTTDVPCLHLGFRQGAVYFGFWYNDSSTPEPFPAGEWHHVAWRYNNATGHQDILIDGVLANSSPGHPSYGQHQMLIVGAAIQHDPGGATGKFGGSLDGPQVFNVLLRDDQILAIARDMPVPP
jgi:Concanavalin A-like lectin/glucanases superfamily